MLFAVLWLAIEFAGVVMQKRMYTYYFVVLAPPAALAYGLLRRPVRLNAFAFGLGPVILAALAWCAPRLPTSTRTGGPPPTIRTP